MDGWFTLTSDDDNQDDQDDMECEKVPKLNEIPNNITEIVSTNDHILIFFAV